MQKTKTRDLTWIALCAALMAVCAWISIPGPVPFTLQTFGVFAAVGMLGGRRGSMAVLVYILLGAVGAPVFAGFAGGPSVLLGATGGYILGFLGSALVMWAMERIPGPRRTMLLVRMLAGQLVCYAFGTVWFVIVWSRQNGPIGFAAALASCVIPFLVPDFIKILLALVISDRVSPALRR